MASVKAMILAAGEGRRMRPLTAQTPKPLLKVKGVPLVEHLVVKLRDAGIVDLVINASYLGDQIANFCGDGSRWGVRMQISIETVPLETAGGIIEALPMLGNDPFIVVNGDVFTAYPFERLVAKPISHRQGHLVLVDNPSHNPLGDFALEGGEITHPAAGHRGLSDNVDTLTFSGIALYHPSFFYNFPRGRRPLKPLLDEAIASSLLSGEYFDGIWSDVGTPERLADLNL